MHSCVRLAVWAMVALSLAACATPMRPLVCPPGQQRLRMAQLFLGQNVAGKPTLSEKAFATFVDEELTPRFPDGLTVLDGGRQWRGPENKLMRESAKVVLIVLPKRGDASPKLEAVRQAYKTRFRQDSVLLVTQAACVSL